MMEATRDPDLIEAEIPKLEAALKKKCSFDALWCAAAAWGELARHSQERTDLKRGIDLFRQACQKGNPPPRFQVDFTQALLQLAALTGDPKTLDEVFERLEYALTSKEESAWPVYARAHKLLFELTGKREDFDKADHIFQQAIVAQPTATHLWLEWGELFLDSGWQRKNSGEIEIALEKFTSLKAEEAPPAMLTTYLGEGLALMGLFADDLKLIRDGKNKLSLLLELKVEFPRLFYAAGMCTLAEGLYFSDLDSMVEAVNYFHRGLELDGQNVRFHHALFQTYFGWGVAFKDPSRLYEACAMIERLVQLRPFSSVHLIEWGVILLRLCQGERDHLEQQALLEEAIDKFRKAAALSDDVEALYQLGTTLDLLGEVTGQEEYYQESIEILNHLHFTLPQDVQITYHLALALSHYGEVSRNLEALYSASRSFKGVLEKDFEDQETWSHLGYTTLCLSELVRDENHPEKSDALREEAEQQLMQAARLGYGEAHYHLAALYSMAGLCERALDHLKRADDLHALPPTDELEHDEWLENVRQTAGFRDFLDIRREHG